MVELCLVRHGIAEERGLAWPDDGLRPLTERGIERWKLGAKGLCSVFAADIVLTSPLTRARQTADILAATGGGLPVRISDSLADDDMAAVARDVQATGKLRVVVVGHEPWMSELVAWSITPGGRAALDFKKGAAALVDFPGAPVQGAGVLAWFLSPALLRALGAGASLRVPPPG